LLQSGGMLEYWRATERSQSIAAWSAEGTGGTPRGLELESRSRSQTEATSDARGRRASCRITPQVPASGGTAVSGEAPFCLSLYGNSGSGNQSSGPVCGHDVTGQRTSRKE